MLAMRFHLLGVGVLAGLLWVQALEVSSIQLTALSGDLIQFEYETVPPTGEALIALPSGAVTHPDGRQFVVDLGDRRIKVFGPKGEFRYSFGGEGQGPGEWLHVGAVSIGPSGNFFVWDDLSMVLHEYQADGTFVRRLYQSDELRAVHSMVWATPNEILLSGLSFAPGYHGWLVHRFRIPEESEGIWRLDHLGSFVDVPDYAPGLYLTLSDGIIAPDGRGGFVATLISQHRVQRYSMDGDLLWSFSDPGVIPNAAETLEVTSTGRIRVNAHARAASIHVAGDWIVHQVRLPPVGLPDLEPGEVFKPNANDLANVDLPQRFEFIRLNDPNVRLVVASSTDELRFRGADQSGGLYAVVGYADPILVRGRLRLGIKERHQS